MDNIYPIKSSEETSSLYSIDNLSNASGTIVEVVQKLSLAADLETIMFIVRKSARKFTISDGATFVLRKGNECFYAAEDAIAPLWQGNEYLCEWLGYAKQTAGYYRGYFFR